MTLRTLTHRLFDGHRTFVFIVLCLCGLCVIESMPPVRKKRPRKPKVTDKRIYLVHADELRYDQYQNRDAQVLRGHVHFNHMGARLYCDSANFFEASNSFEAFGHVKMYQGDTLSLFSDYAYYDGNDELARARYNVVLNHRKTTLYTDSLDYDRMYSLGYFFEGGKLIDNGSVLTSDWGEYHTDTKMAFFAYDVELKDKDFFLTTDSLYYNTQTSVAHIVGPSNIISGNSEIYSENGYYNTKTDHSELFGRSVIRDNGRTMVGDSVFYNSTGGTSYAYGNVEFKDSLNKNMLLGDYCEYNEATGYAMTTQRAMAIDFSQSDSLFMHADTFKVFTYNINTDSVYRVMHAYHKVRAYRVDVQAVCDSLVYDQKDSVMTMYRDPIVWNGNTQLLGEEIRAYMKDSVLDHAHVIGQALSIEQMFDTVHYNQLTSKEMKAFFKDGAIQEAHAINNAIAIYHLIDDADSAFLAQDYTESPLMKMFFKDKKMHRLWAEKPTGTMYPMTQVPPGKDYLTNFVWFDYIRPLNKYDIFNWRGKRREQELKPEKRRDAPVQTLKNPALAAVLPADAEPQPADAEPQPTDAEPQPVSEDPQPTDAEPQPITDE